MPTLVPMTQVEYDAFIERVVPEYAEDKVRAGQWAALDALERSRKEYLDDLPQGVETKNQYLYTVFDGEKEVGMIWLSANPNDPAHLEAEKLPTRKHPSEHLTHAPQEAGSTGDKAKLQIIDNQIFNHVFPDAMAGGGAQAAKHAALRHA